MKSEASQGEGRQVLKLTEWELANLHLPPVTTVTFYSGKARVEFLRQRVASILKKNPWLTARIVKKTTADGVVAMAYSDGAEESPPVDDHFFVYEPEEVGLSLDMDYEALVRCVLPLQSARSRPATDADEALFKVAVVPLGASDDEAGTALLRSRLALPGFALVVSMNHTVGDGHTYYRLYAMLDTDAEVEALDPIRVPGFEAAKTEVIGDDESAMLASAGIALGIVGTYAFTKATRKKPQNVSVHAVDPAWIEQEKAKVKEEAQVPFISTNDALTSWFLREMNCDINLMVANFRSRTPSVVDLTDDHAGNYEANIPYFPGDVETPGLIRQSILGPDHEFRARRAGSPPTRIPSFWTLLRNRAAIITNWASFYRDVTLRADPEREGTEISRPQLHLPIMESDGLMTSIWNSGIVFCPRAGEVGMLMITRRFDSDILAQRKAKQGSLAPMSQRLI